MARADYTYIVDRNKKIKPTIAIIDLDQGGCSVTNDIEGVVAEICEHENLVAKDCFIVYRDSDGMWDGWSDARQDFIACQEDTPEMAILTVMKKETLYIP